MKRNRLFALLCVMVALVGMLWPAAPAWAGGWVVVTIKTLPQAVRAGEAVAVVFIVRQHGQQPVHVDGQLVATRQGSGERVRFAAQRMKQEGHHLVVATFPSAGTWDWYFEPTPFPPNGEFAPLTVLPAEGASGGWWQWLRTLLETTQSANAKVSDAAQGRALFLAKGCASCHVHSEAQLEWSTELGPNLTDYPANPELVRLWLRNGWDLTAGKQWRMPTLELSETEMDALIAFLAE